MSERTQRRLAAIMAADVVGYSRLIRADEEGTLAALKSLRADLIDPKLSQHNGRVVKLMGDGMLAEFPSVVDAVRAAAETQQAVAERNAGMPEDRRIEFRVGINLGDVVIDGDDIHGDGVNVASRLEGLAEPGGVCVSGAVYEQVRNRTDLVFEDLGDQEVKNIDQPVRVWRWVSGQMAPEHELAAAAPEIPSVAVLPFDNMSGDPEHEFFADGMTEDIITALSKFRSFFVIARNSSFTYKGKATDATQVARELGARYVVEGSVRKGGSRLRITAQLIDGESGNHVWAERYDRAIDDIFDVQDEITETIVGMLAPEVSAFERKRAFRRQPASLDAWGLVQRGLTFLWRWDSENFSSATKMFRLAIEKDPSFSQARAYLAFTLLHLHYLGTTSSRNEYFDEADMQAREALALDESDSLAHAVLARVFSRDGRYDDSIKEAQRAVQLNPNYAFAHQSLALMYTWANRCIEGLEPIDQAIRLSPNDPFMHIMFTLKGVILGEIGRTTDAIALLQEACRTPHKDYRPWLFLAANAIEGGQDDLAHDAARKVVELKPDFTASRFRDVWQPMHPAMHDSLARKYLRTGLPA